MLGYLIKNYIDNDIIITNLFKVFGRDIHAIDYIIDIFNSKGDIKCYGLYRVPLVFSKKLLKLYFSKVFESTFLYLQSDDENEKDFF